MDLIRPRLTDHYGIHKSQAELDFAIQFFNEDIPLYVDPFLLWKSPSLQDQSLHTEKAIKYYGHNSYIIINARTEKIHSEYLMTKNKMEYYSLSFLLVAIMCGVIGNLVYNFFKI